MAAIIIAAFGAIPKDLSTRGFVMNGLCQINVSNWGQLVLSALLFAFTHTIWAFYEFRLVISVVLGVILCGLFLWGKRRLRPVIVVHLLPNIICELFSSMLIFLAPVGA